MSNQLLQSVQVENTEEVQGAVTVEHQGNVRAQVRDMRTEIDTLHAQIGHRLHEIFHGGYFRSWSHPETGQKYKYFYEYVEAELDFKGRKAEALVSIWQHYGIRLGMTEDEIGYFSWSKLAKAATVINAENKDAILDYMSKHNVADVSSYVSMIRGSGSGGSGTESLSDLADQVEEEEKSTSKTFRLFPGQLENVEAAFTRAAKMIYDENWDNKEVVKKGHLLDVICSEFNASYAEDEHGDPIHRLDWHIAELQRVFGVKIDYTGIPKPPGSEEFDDDR